MFKVSFNSFKNKNGQYYISCCRWDWWSSSKNVPNSCLLFMCFNNTRRKLVTWLFIRVDESLGSCLKWTPWWWHYHVYGFSTTIPFVHETFCSLVKDNHAFWSVALVEVLCDLNCCSERCALNLANKISTYPWKSKIFSRGPSKTGY